MGEKELRPFMTDAKFACRTNAAGQHMISGFGKGKIVNTFNVIISFLNKYLSHVLDNAGCLLEKLSHLGVFTVQSKFDDCEQASGLTSAILTYVAKKLAVKTSLQ